MSFLSDYTEKNSNLIPQIDIPCFAWNSQAEQGFLFFKAKSLLLILKNLWYSKEEKNWNMSGLNKKREVWLNYEIAAIPDIKTLW